MMALILSRPFDVVTVYVGRSPVEFKKAKPLYRGRLLLIPLREVVAKMGDGPLRRSTSITVGNRRVDLALDGGRSRVNGVSRRIAAAPWISKGEVVAPLKFFSSVLGATTVNDPRRNFVQIVPGRRLGAPRPVPIRVFSR